MTFTRLNTGVFSGADHIGSPITYIESNTCASFFIYNWGSGYTAVCVIDVSRFMRARKKLFEPA